MALTFTIHEAKTNLSRLIAQVEAGEEVVLSRGPKPVAKIVPLVPAAKAKRRLGWLAHTVPSGRSVLDDGFWDPLPDEHLGV